MYANNTCWAVYNSDCTTLYRVFGSAAEAMRWVTANERQGERYIIRATPFNDHTRRADLY